MSLDNTKLLDFLGEIAKELPRKIAIVAVGGTAMMDKFQSHCSGYARDSHLIEAVSEIDTKTLYPIYTYHLDAYKKVLKNMILIEEGVKYSIDKHVKQ